MNNASAKSLAVADYILKKQHDRQMTLTPMQVIKLAYIAHGFCLGVFSRALLDERVEAWPYGPVVRSIYYAVAGSSQAVKKIQGAPNDFPFTEEERQILDYVCEQYGQLSGLTLSEVTHRKETPWSITMEQIGGYYPTISDDLIAHFYKNKVIGKTHDRL